MKSMRKHGRSKGKSKGKGGAKSRPSSTTTVKSMGMRRIGSGKG